MRVQYDADRDAWLVHRPARTWPVPLRAEPHRLPRAPELPDPDGGTSAWTTMLPLVGSLGIVAFAFVVRSVVYLVVAAIMVIALVGGTLGARWATRRRERRRRARVRRAYGFRVAEARAATQADAARQRDALLGLYPDTSGVLRDVRDRAALWERRPHDPDFAHVRLGLGSVPALCPVVLEGDDAVGVVREPDLAAEAADTVTSSARLHGVPVVLPLRSASSVVVVGEPEPARDLAGAWVAALAATCAPTDLRVMGLVPAERASAWDWTKWLPHTRDPLSGEGYGRAARAVTTDASAFAQAVRTLTDARIEQQRRAQEAGGWLRQPDGPQVAAEHVVVLLDGYDPHARELPSGLDVLLARGAELAVTVVLLVREPAAVPHTVGVRVDLLPDGTARLRGGGPQAEVTEGVVPDGVDREAAEFLARLLAPLRPADADAGADLVDTVRLVELLGYDGVEQHDPALDWLRETDLRAAAKPGDADSDVSTTAAVPRPTAVDLLRTPIGLRSDGAPLVLDLKEAAAGGMGPHGMLVGATGSGKSELLRSLVAGMAARHAPELLTMLLVDFKGGAAFTDLGALPHSAGLVTNLAEDPALIDRVRASLSGELERRQQLLRNAGVESLRAYHDLRARTAGMPPLPYLLVVVDEFGELLQAQPEFLDVFVAIGRLGRSLGVHLLLATQRLDEGRIRGLESHLRYRICLRTYSAAESTVVLGGPQAHALPPMPGIGYLRVDAELTRFKAATTSTPHRPVQPHAKAPPVAIPFGVGASFSAPLPDEAPMASGGGTDASTELRALVAQLAQGAASTGAQPARQVWLPPLPDAVQREELPAIPRRRRDATAPMIGIGLVDDPARQRQDVLAIDLSGGGGHVACVGAPRTGRTTFLRTVVDALVDGRTADDVVVYALDLAGGGLHDLQALPHVGAVVGRHQPEGVERLIREMGAVVEERAAAFRACEVTSMPQLRRHPRAAELLPGPLAAEVVLLVDGAGTLRTEFPELDLALADLAAGSLQFGVHVVVTAGRWLDLRPALLDAIGTRFELRLNEPSDSLVGRMAAAAVPAERPGRGLMRDGRAVQIALPEPRPQAGRRQENGDGAPAANAAAPLAPRVSPLPARVHERDVADLATAAGRPYAPPDPTGHGFLVGLGEFRLRPEYVDLGAPGSHLLVLGDDGSGRTTLLRRLVDHLASQSAAGVRLHVVDLSRGLLDRANETVMEHYAFTASLAASVAQDLVRVLLSRLPPPDLTREDLLTRTWWQGPEHVLLVDDYDLTLTGTNGPLGPLADAIAHARDIGFHVVLARRVAGANRTAFEPFGQRLRELSPNALILDGERSEGPVFADRTARRRPPGRGVLVRRGHPDTTVQLALPDPSAVASESDVTTGRRVAS
jgi:S-DNA-T family DNA segregation ATPase FtsK/SpoIIIE